MAILSCFQDFFYSLNDQAKGRGGFSPLVKNPLN